MIIGLNQVGPILRRAAEALNADGRLKGRVRGGQGETVKMLEGHEEWDRARVLRLVEGFRSRRDAGAWEEELVLAGFSDGATLIWQMFNRGEIQSALASRGGAQAGRVYPVAFVGLVDMIRTSFDPLSVFQPLHAAERSERLEDGGTILAGSNYYEQDAGGGWRGTASFYQYREGRKVAHARIRNVLVAEASHYGLFGLGRPGILQTPALVTGLQADIEASYRAALGKAGAGENGIGATAGLPL